MTSPVPAVDIIIEMEGGIVLIARKNPPEGWALPGGFVEHGESLAAAAVREAWEETALHVTLDEQFFCYSDPARDPRQHTVSIVFLAHAEGKPQGCDDARDAIVVSPQALPGPLAFDHAQILEDYLLYRRSGRRPPATR